MREFKVGDKVRRKNGNDFSDGNRVQKIVRIDEINQMAWFKNGTWGLMDLLEHAKTPRKHAELIHRWADDDSMNIETFKLKRWRMVSHPKFLPGYEYREYKPEREDIKRKIEKIEAELKELKERLNND